ncbi:MAG: phage portal protein, partial [Pseudomonadota bacterium]
LPNCGELLVYYLACFKAGLVMTPLNYRYTPANIDYALGFSDVQMLFFHAERQADISASQLAKHLPKGLISLGVVEGALAMGVPPMLLGIPGDNTYSNYREANKSLWRETIIPLVQRMTGELSNWLSQHFGETVDIRIDLDAVPALSEDRERLWRRVESASFLTDDEKREMLGFGPREARA